MTSFMQKIMNGSKSLLLAISILTAASLPALANTQEVFTVGLNATLESLDVHTAIGPNIVGSRVFGIFSDTLVHIGSDGELEPMLATSWRNDGDTWVFELREGVTFHDGSEMTAADVVYSFGRLLDPENAGNFASQTRRQISSVEATGELQVTFTTPETDPLLPLRLTSYWASITSEATAGLDQLTRQTTPIGAGPYRVVEFRTNDRIVLEAHEEYWAGRPAADRVVIRFIPEDATRVAALQAGDVDLITQVPVDQMAHLDADSNVQVLSTVVQNYMTVNLNTISGATADPLVRKAMHLALDRELIADELWNGYSRAMNDLLLPGDFGYDDSRSVYPYDPEGARAALAGSSYDGSPIRLEVTAGYYANGDLITTAMVQMWQDVGLNVVLDATEGSAFLDRYLAGLTETGLQSRSPNGDAQILFEDWYEGTLWRPAYYVPPAEFDEITARTATSLDEEERYADFRRVVEILEADLPMIPVYQNADISAAAANVDWQPHPRFLLDFRPDNLNFR